MKSIIKMKYTIYLNNLDDDCLYFETYEEAKKEWDNIKLNYDNATMTRKNNGGEIYIK